MISSTISRVWRSRRSAGVEPDLAQALGLRSPPSTSPRPDPARAAVRSSDRPMALADLANGGAGAEVDHGRGQPGAVAAIARIDVLDHLLAPLMLEIDVDVGGLVAGLGDEALEDHGDRVGRDLGDAERVADGGIGRRAAPLAEDPAAPRKGDDVVDGQEIGRVVELADQVEFAVDEALRTLGDAGGVAPVEPLLRQPREAVLRALPLPFVGILIAELVEGRRCNARRSGRCGRRPRGNRRRASPCPGARADGIPRCAGRGGPWW